MGRHRTSKPTSAIARDRGRKHTFLTQQALLEATVLVLDNRSHPKQLIYRRNETGGEDLVAGRGTVKTVNLCSWAGQADGILLPHYSKDVCCGPVKKRALDIKNGCGDVNPKLLPHIQGLSPLIVFLEQEVSNLMSKSSFGLLSNIKEVWLLTFAFATDCQSRRLMPSATFPN
ncbi:hypothetical protein BDR26DRAFT_970149 [Obelidium mucronatum]|nr:hypothetical protein BDR26DRAFT_970149 [Obelidium mucronatum]